MKRPLRAAGAAAVIAVALSGCIRVDSDLTLYSDGTGDQIVEMGFANELLEGGDSEFGDFSELLNSADELEAEYEKLGLDDVTVESFETARESGLRVTVTGATIEELNSSDAVQETGASAAVISRDGDTFRVDIPASDLTEGLDPESGLQPEQLSLIFTITSSVTFPGPIIDSKGGTVEGNTITWDNDDLLAGEALYAVGKASANSSIPLWVWIALAALVIAAVVVALIVQTNRSKTVDPAAPAPNGAAVTPPPPAASTIVTAGGAPQAKKSAGKKPAAKKPAARKPAAKKPAPKDSPGSGENTK